MCLSELIPPPVLSIAQSIMVWGQGYLGAAAAGGQFGSKAIAVGLLLRVRRYESVAVS